MASIIEVECCKCASEIAYNDSLHMECSHIYCNNCLRTIVDDNCHCYECDEDISNNRHVAEILAITAMASIADPILQCRYCPNTYQKIDGFILSCDHTCCLECVVKRSYEDISGNYFIRCHTCLKTTILNNMFKNDPMLRAKKATASKTGAIPKTNAVPKTNPIPKPNPIHKTNPIPKTNAVPNAAPYINPIFCDLEPEPYNYTAFRSHKTSAEILAERHSKEREQLERKQKRETMFNYSYIDPSIVDYTIPYY